MSHTFIVRGWAFAVSEADQYGKLMWLQESNLSKRVARWFCLMPESNPSILYSISWLQFHHHGNSNLFTYFDFWCIASVDGYFPAASYWPTKNLTGSYWFELMFMVACLYLQLILFNLFIFCPSLLRLILFLFFHLIMLAQYRCGYDMLAYHKQDEWDHFHSRWSLKTIPIIFSRSVSSWQGRNWHSDVTQPVTLGNFLFPQQLTTSTTGPNWRWRTQRMEWNHIRTYTSMGRYTSHGVASASL